MTLQRKLIISKLGLALVPLIAASGILLWRTDLGFRKAIGATESAFHANAQRSRDALVSASMADLSHVAQDVYATCQAQQELLQQKVTNDLNVARKCVEDAGGIAFAPEMVNWDAVNQTTKESVRVELPRMLAGKNWLGQNKDASLPSPVVDQVRQLVGTNCTIFQRMNEAGDMLRVCTNVQESDGSRAIATYVPAVTPDKKPNPVVSQVLNGETYLGRAMVVGQWCVSAYEPIRDEQKRIVGMLYVGVPEQSAKSLRNALMAVQVGQTGYVFVLNATGTSRGCYVLSQGGKRDGENIWEAKDANGKLFIQEACQIATGLKPGEVGEIRYPWKNEGDTQARNKITKLTYFAPWDWVIGVGAYEDEFYRAVTEMEQQAKAAVDNIRTAQADAGSSVKVWTLAITGVVAVIACAVAFWVSRSISRLLIRAIAGLTEGANQVTAAAGQVADASQSLAEGSSEQASSLEQTSAALQETTAQTRASAENAARANDLAGQAKKAAEHSGSTIIQLNQAMAGINEASEKVGKINKVIEEIAFQTNLLALNAAVEAARAGEHGKGFAVVADEVRNLAQRAAQAARETTNLIADSVSRARQGNEVAAEAGKALTAIGENVSRVSDLLSSIHLSSQEQAEGVQQINDAVTAMDQVTQSNAAGAEESAAAAEELSSQANAMMAYVESLTRLVGIQNQKA